MVVMFVTRTAIYFRRVRRVVGSSPTLTLMNYGINGTRKKIMTFADAIREEGKHTLTENGAFALNTTDDARLNFFSTVGSLRNTTNVSKRYSRGSWRT